MKNLEKVESMNAAILLLYIGARHTASKSSNASWADGLVMRRFAPSVCDQVV
jgi:hypothetical protein